MSAWVPARASLRPRYRRKLPLSAGTTYVDDLVLGLCLPDSAFGRPGSKKYCCRYSTMPWYKFTRSRGTPPALISTLNPALLRPSDHLDFSHHEEVIIRFPRSTQRTYALFRYCSLANRQTAPFPAGCAGFLYYWTPQDKDRPPLGLGSEGSVRLRLTSDPSSFEAGEDLRLPTGAPWQTILPQIARRKQDSTLARQLLAENLVTPAQLACARRVFAGNDRITPQLTLFRLGQEFPVDFADGGVKLSVVGDDKLRKIHFPRLFSDEWSGSALASFEPSTRPAHTAAGRRVVCLRFGRIVHPVSCAVPGYGGPFVKPEEGRLLMLGGGAPWAYDIDADIDADEENAQALRVLWDNSGGASRQVN
ncbi:hypothetical protein DFH08DRAFT_971194 [Mycena albidolilacea]|uniref:Uncharacterized protein n=1 Tax=Mycena albidolilacea TaxID=1033008 RepID=A0AAD6ZDW8_9AGAR|nr:hypothetical protein DFH08DRAFT_971194 [Mycena albidolilacea]